MNKYERLSSSHVFPLLGVAQASGTSMVAVRELSGLWVTHGGLRCRCPGSQKQGFGWNSGESMQLKSEGFGWLYSFIRVFVILCFWPHHCSRSAWVFAKLHQLLDAWDPEGAPLQNCKSRPLWWSGCGMFQHIRAVLFSPADRVYWCWGWTWVQTTWTLRQDD